MFLISERHHLDTKIGLKCNNIFDYSKHFFLIGGILAYFHCYNHWREYDFRPKRILKDKKKVFLRGCDQRESKETPLFEILKLNFCETVT